MLISQRPTITEEFVNNARSRFVIEPLEPGFGYTLGNSLRRTLLSSIPGAAVTSVKIDGVLHEFTTISGVKEDVSDIILNIKGLVLSSDSDEPVVMQLVKEGPGVVTAGDIQPPAGVEIHNPDLHIATLNETAKIEIELIVERGRGYVPATVTATGGEIGRIPVDQIYSPVLRSATRLKLLVLSSAPTLTSWSSTLRPRTLLPHVTPWRRQVRPWLSCSASHAS